MARFISSCRRITRAAAFGSTAIILCLMLITTIDVSLRYVFSRPIRGVSEIGEYLLVILVFLALAYAQFHGRHVNVTIFTNRFPPRIQSSLQISILVVLVALFLTMTWKSAETAYSFYQVGEIRWNVPWPVWPARFFVPLGAFLLSIEFLAELLSSLKPTKRKG
ncbi:MAG: hypothetical protein HW414_847 [Dehalococcoidia bacterium]|nr:hypothetical protein [Dehalococcoidia bacterium]